MSRPRAVAGLDFGMTNSILATYEPVRGPVAFQRSGADSPAVPTVIAGLIGKIASFVFGRAALSSENRLANFKIRLPKAGRDARNWKSNPDYQTARQFLSALLAEYLAEQEATGFDQFVVTVPENWLSGSDQVGIGVLGAILKECGIHEPRFLSEPVGAASYFAYHYQTSNQGTPFHGHVLVYDHGGSTLDLALVKIDGSSISVLDGLGNGGVSGDSGFGGVEYDRRVLARLAARPRNARLADLNARQKEDWLLDFEQLKRDSTQLINQRLSGPDPAELRDEEIFCVGRKSFLGQSTETSVTLGDIEDVFEDHFAPRIRADVEQLLSIARDREKIAIQDPAVFRVLSVGGFSQFPPAHRLLTDIVTVHTKTEASLKSGIDKSDRWQAIAKGAALVAAEKIEVLRTCPYTFGFLAYHYEQPQYRVMMAAGDLIETYGQPKYIDQWFRIGTLSTQDAVSIKFFIERGGRSTIIPMTRSFNEVLPDIEGVATRWQLGCRVDNSAVRLCLRSDTGSTKTYRMGDILSMMSGRFEEDAFE